MNNLELDKREKNTPKIAAGNQLDTKIKSYFEKRRDLIDDLLLFLYILNNEEGNIFFIPFDTIAKTVTSYPNLLRLLAIS